MSRSALCFLVVAPITLLAAAACSDAEPQGDRDSESVGALTSGSPTGLTLPVPGSKDNAISPADQATIVDAWVQAKHDFYDVPLGSTKPPAYVASSPDGEPSYTEVALVPCPSYYSELVCRFYGHMPSYARVTPNVRGCFSPLANADEGLEVPSSPGGRSRKAVYPEIWDYCMYEGFDPLVPESRPAYNLLTIKANKAANIEVGVLKDFLSSAGVDQSNRLRAVFKYIMYTWYEPATYKAEDQAAIIKSVHHNIGVPVPPAGTQLSSHPESRAIVAAMKAYFNGNYELDGAVGRQASAVHTF